MVIDERERLGELLVNAELITQKQLEMALEMQQQTGGAIGTMLTKLGFLSEEQLTSFIAEKQGIKVVNLSELILPENLIRRLPVELIRKHHIIPIHFSDGVLTVAMADPTDFEAIDEIQLAVDFRVEVNMAPKKDIDKAISEIFDRETGVIRKEDLLKALDGDGGGSDVDFLDAQSTENVLRATISLLIEKGVFTVEEMQQKLESQES
jgi:type IV pilus assembly protein PilB